MLETINCEIVAGANNIKVQKDFDQRNLKPIAIN
jgi:hypothetical protein